MNEPIEPWRAIWRDALAPQFSDCALAALAQALERDDPALLQGATTVPIHLTFLEAEPVTACCPVAYLGWQGEGLRTVAHVATRWVRTLFEADKILGAERAAHTFIQWWDATPRPEAVPLLLAEVRRSIRQSPEVVHA